MSIEDLARDAAAELRDTASADVDVDVVLGWLEPASRRRSRVRTVGISGAVLVLAVAGWLGGRVGFVAEPAGRPMPSPSVALYHGNGPIDVITGAFDPPPGGVDNEVVAVSTSTGKSTQTIGPGYIAAISWSPDGTQLAYIAARGVFVLTPATGVTRFLGACACSKIPVSGVAWSPNGRYIAVANLDQLQLWSPDGGRTKTIVTLPSGYAFSPSWSPDSNRLVFVALAAGQWGMDVVNADGSHLTTLVGPLPSDRMLDSPAWSPDGSQIAYLEGAPLHCGSRGSALTSGLPCYPGFPWTTYSVMLIHPDGSNLTRLHAAGSTSAPDFIPSLGWSPDGTSMALIIPGPTPAVVLTGPGLYVMNRDGSEIRRLDRNSWGGPLAWQPIP
jgi:WD40-like Beta Propeller Repeat